MVKAPCYLEDGGFFFPAQHLFYIPQDDLGVAAMANSHCLSNAQQERLISCFDAMHVGCGLSGGCSQTFS